LKCPIIRNVRIIDCGERYIKGSTNTGIATSIVDDGLIENVYMEQITALSGHPDNNCVGGILRNNFVTRGAGIAVELCFTKNLKVYYNSISADASYWRTVQIYDTAGQTTRSLREHSAGFGRNATGR
jgi:hypothetical protein